VRIFPLISNKNFPVTIKIRLRIKAELAFLLEYLFSLTIFASVAGEKYRKKYLITQKHNDNDYFNESNNKQLNT
jgi:hypothetical protein